MKGAFKTSVKIFLTLILLSLASFNAAGFGIVMPYWEGRPLTVQPGETRDVALKLQNVGEEDLKLEVRLTEGSEIARITDKSLTYTVLGGNTDTRINLRISVPQNDTIGTQYRVGVSIKDISSKGSGMVQLTNTIDKSFDVVVGSESPVPKAEPVETPKPTEGLSLLTILVVIAVLAVIAVALLLFAKRENAQMKTKRKFK